MLMRIVRKAKFMLRPGAPLPDEAADPAWDADRLAALGGILVILGLVAGLGAILGYLLAA